MNNQVVGNPVGLWQRRVRDQAVQLLPIHAAQGFDEVVCDHGAVTRGAVLDVTLQLSVPGHHGQGARCRATRSRHTPGLALHQDHRLQAGDGLDWEGETKNWMGGGAARGR